MLKDMSLKLPVLDMIAVWKPEHILGIAQQNISRTPVIQESDVTPIIPGFDIWDMWPLALRDGYNAAILGGTLWFALSAPVLPDPIDRHGQARIRLLHQINDKWVDCGTAIPDGVGPGSRDWSGSAIYDFISRKVTVFFTAAGRIGEKKLSVEQRLYKISGILDLTGKRPVIKNWSQPYEIFESDDDIYTLVNQVEGLPGKLKAFRDPAFFRDPKNGRNYVVFAGSLKKSKHEANGIIGISHADDEYLDNWNLLPPLLSADGVNNELERPHLVYKGGLYYLFWSTQSHVFAPDLSSAPTGLYGMVADNLFGPYEPINGTGLVFANPESEMLQAYSWWVMADLSVTSFVDYWGMQGRSLVDHPELVRNQFGGVPAPFLKLDLDGSKAELRPFT